MTEENKNKPEEVVNDERLIDIWGRRSPRFEKIYEQTVLRVISDYGVGASKHTTDKGKVLGAGYEPYIMAFFIGLYSNKRLPLSDDTNDLKVLGQPLDKWGNLDSKKNRHAYSELRPYIFMALVAKTDIDWIALDKGQVKVSVVITKLIETMEEYANYGFAVMEEKLKNDKGFFFSNRSFLDIFMELTRENETNMVDDEVEEL